MAAYVQIDRDVQVFGQDAPLDAAATGESDERGPNARFALWAVADGPARIANYLDWLNRCGSYLPGPDLAAAELSGALATAYCGGIAGGGYTPRRIHGSQLMPYSISSLAS